MDLTLPSIQDLSHSDGNLTGKVGTALYVSPEVMQGGVKVRYDQVSPMMVCYPNNETV